MAKQYQNKNWYFISYISEMPAHFRCQW